MINMWRRDYEDYEDHGTSGVRRVYILGGGEPDVLDLRGRPTSNFDFSETEIRNLAIAILILSVAFALALSDFAYYGNLNFFLVMLAASFVIVSTGFALHEVGHKFAAQNYGCWAEFRYSEFGLFLSLIVGFLGMIIAVPGAVYIKGNITTEENGKISAAGPLVNVALTPLFIIILFIGIFSGIDFLVLLGAFGAWVNPIIAAFNMIPLYPLDGSKIWSWSPVIYIFMAVIIGALAVVAYIYFLPIFYAAYSWYFG